MQAPSNQAVVAIAGAVTSAGSLSNGETVVLLTAEQIDDAAKTAVAYPPPGG